MNFPLADTTGCTHAGEDIELWPLNREPCGLQQIWAKVAWNMASNTIQVAMRFIQMASKLLGLWESCAWQEHAHALGTVSPVEMLRNRVTARYAIWANGDMY